jgi:hypothetical protein
VGVTILQSGEKAASVLNSTDKTDAGTSHGAPSVYQKLMYLVMMLPLFGCEFDSQNPGILVSPTSGLVTNESGTTAQFTITLNSKPDAMVAIPVFSSDTSEGEVNPAQVSFSASNWSTPKTVSVFGKDDSLPDGDIAYSINFQPTQSGDQRYNNLSIAAISAVNQDDDGAPSAGVTITPSSGLQTSENLTTDAFTLVLDSQPASTVTVAISSSDTSEGTASPASLTFTTGNWNSPQTVMLTGADDSLLDGDVNYTILFNVQSSDSNYNGLTLAPITAVNQDNDATPSAGITITPSSGLQTSENLTTDIFTVVLNTQPTGLVTVAIISSDTSEGTVSPTSLTFTTSNWNSPQTVTLTGADDSLVDGDANYTILFNVQSSDSNYNGLTLAPITAVNQDNDATPSAGITITPSSGLQTSEDLATDAFTLVLDSQPASTVTVAISSSDTSEGSVSPASLTFTTGNWNSPQIVTLTGADDSLVDGDANYSILFNVQSSDSNYNGLTLTPVTAVNLDNDSPPSAGVTITPSAGLQTSEDLTTDTFTLVLGSQPADTVTIAITSSDTGEGSVSPSSILFTTGNWDIAQTITVTGVDDTLMDGAVDYNIAFNVQSADSNYSGLALTPVTATNQDNDTTPATGITVTPSAGLQTSEDLTTDTFTVVLDSQPTDTVTVTLTSSDSGEGTVSPGSLSFTTANWSTPQAVTVSGVDDPALDGDTNYSISFNVQSNDSNYNGLSLTPVTAVNQDNDTAAITVTPSSGLVTSEDLTTDTFTVALTSQPTDTVTVTLTSSDTGEGTVSPASLTFTIGNWNSAQTVTVSGEDDAQVDGDVSYTISFSIQSTDSNYNGMAITPVSAVNQDNDVITPPPSNYVLYIEPGIIDIAASTITGNGAAQLPAVGYALSNTLPGQTPGPVIEAMVGQTTTIEVVNDHLNPHGFEIEGLLTNTPVLLPGETLQFQFTPTEAGVYRYGDPDLLRRALGLQGAVVVRPADNPNTAWTGGPAFDQKRTWVIADFDETWLLNPAGVDTALYNPNYFLMNGKSGFAAKEDPASTIVGNVGETFLIRIVNAGQFDQSLHFHSNHFQIISEGGFKYTNPATAPVVTTINVKRASTAMILFTLTQTGTYPVHVHTAQMETGNGVYLNGTATFIIGN